MNAPKEAILGWHWIAKNKRLGYKDKRLVKVGQTLSIEDDMVSEINPCRYGMHASRKLEDSIGYAPGPVLCRVKVWGNVKEQDDKLVGQHRQCLWMVPNADKIINEYFLKKYIKTASRSLKRLIRVALRYNSGKITLREFEKSYYDYSGPKGKGYDPKENNVLAGIRNMVAEEIEMVDFGGSAKDYLKIGSLMRAAASK